MKNSIVMIYGPHHSKHFNKLAQILDLQIELLKKTSSSIETIIEYHGPRSTEFLHYKNMIKRESPEATISKMNFLSRFFC